MNKKYSYNELEDRTEAVIDRAIKIKKTKYWVCMQLSEILENTAKLCGSYNNEARAMALDIFEDELSEMEAEYEKNKLVLNAEELKLVDALKRAVAEAAKLKDTEDGGTCNFDAPKLYLPKWKKKHVEAVLDEAGLSGFEHAYVRGGVKGWVIGGGTSGQGNRRSRMAECICNCLKADGYDCDMYYQTD